MSINKNEKNTLIIYIAIIMIILVLAGTIFSYQSLEKSITDIPLKTIANDIYEIQYTNYWLETFGDEKGFELKRNNSIFKLVVRNLEESEFSKDVLEFSNEAMYEITDFKSYKLRINEPSEISEQKYGGYEKLLEKDDESIMLYTIKDYRSVYNFSFKSDSRDFDRGLVEVETDLQHLIIQNENVFIYSKEFVSLKEPVFSIDEKLDNMIIQNTTVEISENDYDINFSLPSNFLADKDSKDFIASFKGLDANEQGSISIKINIINQNGIEYLTNNVEPESEKDSINSENINNFSDYYSKIDQSTYMYFESYYYNPWRDSKGLSTNSVDEKGSEMKYETCYLVFLINNENSVVVKIESKVSGITSKLIYSLKLLEAKKIAEN